MDEASGRRNVAGLVRGRRKAIGSRWRKMNPGRQSLLALAFLRHDQCLAELAGGNDISAATLRRWVLEVIGLLAARAPRLDRALKKIAKGAASWCCWTAPWCTPGAAPERRTGPTTQASTSPMACSSSP
nr:transposase family protein [Streptomyces sp. 846.5]